MRDWRGTEIEPGDTIVYPVNKVMVEAEVVEVSDDTRHNPAPGTQPKPRLKVRDRVRVTTWGVKREPSPDDMPWQSRQWQPRGLQRQQRVRAVVVEKAERPPNPTLGHP